MKQILKITLVMVVIILGLGTEIIAREPIKLVVDGRTLVLDQPPVTEDDHILLPLRETFEALGAEVDWDNHTQIVTAIKDNLVLKLQIGKQQASLNNKEISMDVAGKKINGRAMVPIRFVSENLGVKVTWDGKNKKVAITTDSARRYRNTNLKDDFIEITAQGDHKLTIKGKTLSNNRYIVVEVLDSKEKDHLNKHSKIRGDRTFKQEYDVNLNEGVYTINVYMNDKEYGSYQGVYIGINMHKTKAGIIFEDSPVYESNLEYLGHNNKVSSLDLNLDGFSQKDKMRLLELATRITKNKQTDYDKTLAVSEWVSQNIYYDLDAFNARTFGKTDAIGTLDERRSICQGYAALTMALLRSIGIPTKLVFGYALGVDPGSDTWEEANDRRPNHVWNEVFIDSRWIIVDTTWNSKNRYEKGKYIEGNAIYSYFDPSIKAFSSTHKITNR